MKAGIIGYGVAIPHFRIKAEEIARVWGKDGAKVAIGLGVREKAVASIDEDSGTLAVEASREAVKHASIDPSQIGAVYIGSESKPYAVKPTATLVTDAIGAGPYVMSADYEFACKAGTAGMQNCLALVRSGMIQVGLAVGTDTAQGRPGDALEFTAASGAGAMLIGKDKLLAEITTTASYSSDTPDFWRRQHEEFPQHAGRFTGEPAYFRHVLGCANRMFELTKTTSKDFDYVVFHQPNGKFPVRVAKMLGFSNEQVLPGLITPYIGNTYSGACFIGLASVLDVAKENDRILLVSYGSGAGSDGFDMTVLKENEIRKTPEPVAKLIQHKSYLDYGLYAKHRRKIKSM